MHLSSSMYGTLACQLKYYFVLKILLDPQVLPSNDPNSPKTMFDTTLYPFHCIYNAFMIHQNHMT